jgi:hypothetical protein
MSDGCVAIRSKMLTYSVYAPLLNRIDALPSNTIWAFKATLTKLGISDIGLRNYKIK